MTLGSELSNEFRINSTREPFKEIALFRCLKQSLLNLRSYNVAEIHGMISQVTYDSVTGWFAKNAQCELGDILIIAYSKAKRNARLIIMQNKLRHSSKTNSVPINLVQHELLSIRPDFTFKKKPGRICRLLHVARNSSICIYGCFYENNGYDMAAYTANHLEFYPKLGPYTGIGLKKTVYYNGICEDLTTIAHLKADFTGTDNLLKFGDLLEHLHIGEPIHVGLKCHIVDSLNKLQHQNINLVSTANFNELFQEFKELGLNEYIDRNLSDIGLNNAIYDELYSVIGLSKSIILLNVDKKEIK